jgi:hypothetical protein
MFGSSFEMGSTTALRLLKYLRGCEGDMAGRHSPQTETAGDLACQDFRLGIPGVNTDTKDLVVEAKRCTGDNCCVGGAIRLDDQKWIHMRHDACRADVHHVYYSLGNDKETPRRRRRRRRKGAGRDERRRSKLLNVLCNRSLDHASSQLHLTGFCFEILTLLPGYR